MLSQANTGDTVVDVYCRPPVQEGSEGILSKFAEDTRLGGVDDMSEVYAATQ